MSYRVADEQILVHFLAEAYDPWQDGPRDEPPELDDADWAMAMYDPNLGWLDAP